MTERYYAQYDEVPSYWLSGHRSAWMVFDRENLDEQGAVRSIAIGVNRDAAFTIRDALNSGRNLPKVA